MPIPFTNPWQDNIPGDGTQAALIGADIRQARLDVSDRMGVLFSDWETNQNGLTLLPTAGGAVTGLLQYIPSALWVTGDSPGNWNWVYGNANQSLSIVTAAPNVGTIILACPIIIPVTGEVITKIQLFYDQAAGAGAFATTFGWTNPALGNITQTVLFSGNTSNTHAGGSQTLVILASGSYTVLPQNYSMYVVIPSTSVTGALLTIYGAAITYNRPNVQFAP